MCNLRVNTKALAAVFCLLVMLPSSVSAQKETQQKAAERLFLDRDTNKDGLLSRKEFPQRWVGMFDRIDANKDGQISLAEDMNFRINLPARSRRSPLPPLPKGATVHRDLTYSKVGDRALPLDLYLPAETDKLTPVVMWIHGGGWRQGSKGSAGPARALVARGYAVVDVEYRLTDEAIFPAQIQDCKAAVRWVRANATKYKLDPNKIGAWGSSAGGHLVALMGTAGDVKEFETDSNAEFSSRVQAVCNWFGPTNLLKMNQQAIVGAKMDHDAPNSPESLLVGGPLQKSPFRNLADKANPINYATADDPPMLIVHGDKDVLVSPLQSEDLFKALKEKSVQVRLHIEPGAGHGLRGGKLSRQTLEKQAADFFDQQFNPASMKQ